VFAIWPQIEQDVTAGDIAVDDVDATSLTTRGQAWWRKQYADNG
jgi:hypothetical protein